MRRRRNAWLARKLRTLPVGSTVLDVGGTFAFWERSALVENGQVRVTVLNRRLVDATSDHDDIVGVDGDATELKYDDGAFDVVFSNSVIEHVGDLADQRRMADEVARVGHRYWVQTPARWFPLEPHFLFPFFGVLPIPVRAWLIRHFSLGWRTRQPEKAASYRTARSVRLLSRRELRDLFPGATIERERVAGITKSWVVLGGWDAPVQSGPDVRTNEVPDPRAGRAVAHH
jgi:hypothetical protein